MKIALDLFFLYFWQLLIAIGVALTIYLFKKNGEWLKFIVLAKSICNSGIINIYPNRLSYRKIGKASDYINQAKHNFMYVGFWLADGIENADILASIKKLINDNVKVTIIFMDPEDTILVEAYCRYSNDIEKDALIQRIKNSIKQMRKIQCNLDPSFRDNLLIKLHNVPLSASIFMIDWKHEKSCKLLLDYKPPHCERVESIGFECQGPDRLITRKYVLAYESILEQSRTLS